MLTTDKQTKQLFENFQQPILDVNMKLTIRILQFTSEILNICTLFLAALLLSPLALTRKWKTWPSTLRLSMRGHYFFAKPIWYVSVRQTKSSHKNVNKKKNPYRRQMNAANKGVCFCQCSMSDDFNRLWAAAHIKKNEEEYLNVGFEGMRTEVTKAPEAEMQRASQLAKFWK